MAERQSCAATRGELYAVAVLLCGQLFIVLTASAKPEGHWMRTFATCSLVVMQLLLLGPLLLALRGGQTRDKGNGA